MNSGVLKSPLQNLEEGKSEGKMGGRGVHLLCGE